MIPYVRKLKKKYVKRWCDKTTDVIIVPLPYLLALAWIYDQYLIRWIIAIVTLLVIKYCVAFALYKYHRRSALMFKGFMYVYVVPRPYGYKIHQIRDIYKVNTKGQFVTIEGIIYIQKSTKKTKNVDPLVEEGIRHLKIPKIFDKAGFDDFENILRTSQARTEMIKELMKNGDNNGIQTY